MNSRRPSHARSGSGDQAPPLFENHLLNPRKALSDFQSGPKIAWPNVAQSFIPVVGPAWQAVGDIQDKNYTGAAVNLGFAVADAFPVGVGVKGARALSKGVGLWKSGSVSANAATKQLRKKIPPPAKHEVHHTMALNGKSRTAQDFRNHYPFLKVLPQATHRRLHGSWDGEARFGPIGRAWHGTTDWQKVLPVGAVTYTGDKLENLTRAPRDPQRRK